jgi:hypothetical protein
VKTIFNDQLEFETDEELEILLNNLNTQFATKIIELGIEMGLSQGLFDLTESHCLYKCIQYIKTLENTPNNTYETK